MRKLFLLRHAKASRDNPDLDDAERPLDERGRRAARRMAQFMAGAGIRPALALISTSTRTRATWDIVETAMEGTSAAIENVLYLATRGEMLDRLRKVDDHVGSVMLIGHNPGIERLAKTLVGHHGDAGALDRLAEKFPTCALAEIDLDIDRWAELEDGCGRLERFVRPRDLDGGG